MLRRERPVLFSGEMVRAILAGTKSQTRRLVDMRHIGFIGGRSDDHNDPALWGYGDIDGCWHVLDQAAEPWCGAGVPHESYAITCPYGGPGSRLWVRETWAAIDKYSGYETRKYKPSEMAPSHNIPIYAATVSDFEESVISAWRPSIFMPRWASRITLELTDVRVQRLQDISEDDARAEGLSWVPPTYGVMGVADSWRATAREAFAALWNSLNKHPGTRWEDNPWTWAISFRSVEASHVAA